MHWESASRVGSACADGPVSDGTGWMKPPLTEESKKQALEAGIVLADRSVQEHLTQVFEKKRKMESESEFPHPPRWYLVSGSDGQSSSHFYI